jgi:hypothetical protein
MYGMIRILSVRPRRGRQKLLASVALIDDGFSLVRRLHYDDSVQADGRAE